MGRRGPNARPRPKTDDLETSFPWHDNMLTRPEKVVAFLEWLPITKGKKAGEKMKLLDKQREFIEAVYGNLDENGRKKVRLAVKSEPRGNGKTGLLSGLALCHLLGPESEPRGEIYSAAIDKHQAGILFNEMEAIIYAVPEFDAIINIRGQKKEIEVGGDGSDDGGLLASSCLGSKYIALSKDARAAHGLAPSMWIYDEMAQTHDRELLDNLRTALGKRNESLGVIISTQAPSDDHALSQILDDAATGEDDSIYAQLVSAPGDADPFDPQVLIDCNPAIGEFLDLDDLLKEQAQAKRLPSFEARFRNLRLNQRVDANEDSRIVTASVWKSLGTPVNFDSLKGKRCFGGLDLSGTMDLTSLVLIFPNDAVEPSYDVVPFFWTPLDAMEQRRPDEQERFRLWMSQGFLEGIPGPIIRYDFIARRLAEIADLYDIRGIAYDRWRIKDLQAEMDEIGLQMVMEPFGQGFKDMGPALEMFQQFALSGQLRHGNNPVLTACVANAVVTRDAAGYGKFDKDKSNRPGAIRIDGAVALAMALGGVNKFHKPLPVSPWSDPNYSLAV